MSRSPPKAGAGEGARADGESAGGTDFLAGGGRGGRGLADVSADQSGVRVDGMFRLPVRRMRTTANAPWRHSHDLRLDPVVPQATDILASGLVIEPPWVGPATFPGLDELTFKIVIVINGARLRGVITDGADSPVGPGTPSPGNTLR